MLIREPTEKSQFPIPPISNDLNPCLGNLSLNTESEPVLHISLVDAISFDVGSGFDSISPDNKICLSDELHVTVNILYFAKYLL